MKKLSLLLIFVLLAVALCACLPESNTPDNNTNKIEYTKILPKQAEVTLGAGETKSVELAKDISAYNYIKLSVKNSGNIIGKYYYHNVENANEAAEEDFYLEPSYEVVDFTQFFDEYRNNSVGKFKKVLDKITFRNADSSPCTLLIESISVAYREFPTQDLELYISSENLKVGADLSTGGALTYLERTQYGEFKVSEYLTKDNRISIGIDVENNDDWEMTLSDHVNLINIYDVGRQFQQSYYANIGGSTSATNGENGYTRALCKTADVNGYYWPYNPVQGGDCGNNISQIVDFQVTETTLYIRTRAMDWAYGLDWESLGIQPNTTKSYTDSRYEIKNDMLYAYNRFIDWSEFTDLDNIGTHSLEIPATYVVHPLNNYVCYTGTNPWTKDVLTVESSLGDWAKGAHTNNRHLEDWFAWTNDYDFGVGVYIPGATTYASGRSDPSTSIKDHSRNSGAFNSPMVTKYLYNKPQPVSNYTSCYVLNTSYTAPVVSVKMKEFVAIDYTYVVAVDLISIFRKEFQSLAENNIIDNSGLKNWD